MDVHRNRLGARAFMRRIAVVAIAALPAAAPACAQGNATIGASQLAATSDTGARTGVDEAAEGAPSYEAGTGASSDDGAQQEGQQEADTAGDENVVDAGDESAEEAAAEVGAPTGDQDSAGGPAEASQDAQGSDAQAGEDASAGAQPDGAPDSAASESDGGGDVDTGPGVVADGAADSPSGPLPACAAAYDQANCLAYAQSTTIVSSGGHNWLCFTQNCRNCGDPPPTGPQCAPGGTGCPWGAVWTDQGACQ